MFNIGIRNTELAWFSNYFKDRLEYVYFKQFLQFSTKVSQRNPSRVHFRPFTFSTLQGVSDISGTLSKLHYSIKKSAFLLILSQQTISAVCRTICKNKQTHFGKDELAGTSKRRDCLWTSRRTDREGDYELQKHQ
jgi:hypothetical protein